MQDWHNFERNSKFFYSITNFDLSFFNLFKVCKIYTTSCIVNNTVGIKKKGKYKQLMVCD